MITEEHLKQWLGEIRWQLNGIQDEVAERKVQMKGINVGKNGEAWVSFEYLQEKAWKIQKFLALIDEDIISDEMPNLQ